jgi:hypothetical protein
VDFSSYMLSSLAANNTAIKFSYMQPNETFAPSLRGNYSVISFFVPHDEESIKNNVTKGIFGFLSNLRLPWRRPDRSPTPSDTDVSKFPPLLEYFTQRIQAYFSVYKYSDDSRVNNTIVVFAPGPEDFPETSVRVENDEFADTTELLGTAETTEVGETGETTEVNGETTEVNGETTEMNQETTEVNGETRELNAETTEVNGGTTEKFDETMETTETTEGKVETTESFERAFESSHNDLAKETKEATTLEAKLDSYYEENYLENDENEV